MVLIAAPSTVPGPPAVDGGISSGKQPAGFEGTAAAAWDLKAPTGWAADEAGTPTTGSSTASSPGPPSMSEDEDDHVTPRPPLIPGIRREASDEMETEAAASILSSVLPDMAKLSNSLASARGAPAAAPHAARAAAAARGYEDLLTTLASLASGCRPLDPLHSRLSQVSMDDGALAGDGRRSLSSPSLKELAEGSSGSRGPRRRTREEQEGSSGAEGSEEDEKDGDGGSDGEEEESVGSGGSWSGGGGAAARRRARMMGRVGGGGGGGGRARSVSMPEGCDAWNRYASAAPATGAAAAAAAAGAGFGAGVKSGGSAAALASAAAVAAAAAAAAAEAGGAGGCNPILPHMLAKYSNVYNKHGRIGIYTREERAAIIHRFLQKRARRVWAKKVRYACRKNLADKRIRVKGRFIKLDPSAEKAEKLSVIEEGKALADDGGKEEGEAGSEEEGSEAGSDEQEREQAAARPRMRRHSICF